MGRFIVAIAIGASLLVSTAALAHCGKTHPDSKDKGQSSTHAPKPE